MKFLLTLLLLTSIAISQTCTVLPSYPCPPTSWQSLPNSGLIIGICGPSGPPPALAPCGSFGNPYLPVSGTSITNYNRSIIDRIKIHGQNPLYDDAAFWFVIDESYHQSLGIYPTYSVDFGPAFITTMIITTPCTNTPTPYGNWCGVLGSFEWEAPHLNSVGAPFFSFSYWYSTSAVSSSFTPYIDTNGNTYHPSCLGLTCAGVGVPTPFTPPMSNRATRLDYTDGPTVLQPLIGFSITIQNLVAIPDVANTSYAIFFDQPKVITIQ